MFDPLIAARAVHFASTIMMVGAIFFDAFVLAPSFRTIRDDEAVVRIGKRLMWIELVGLALVFVSGAAWLIILTIDITRQSLGPVLSQNLWWTVLTQTQFGRDWQIRFVVATSLALIPVMRERGVWQNSRLLGAAEVALGACLVGALAWSGHGASDQDMDGKVHLTSDVLHLLAASAWLGALVPLALVFTAAPGDENRAVATLAATRRFSAIGVVSVGTLLITGSINTWYLTGSIPALIGTAYGQLLLVKIALFAVMVATAAVNRLSLTPRLARGFTIAQRNRALRQLARNSLFEASLGLAILAIVGALGTIPPGLHQPVSWPLPLRFNEGAWADEQLRQSIVAAAILAAAAALILISACRARRWRWPLASAGLVAVIVATLNLKGLAVPAFPTSFSNSPTGYSAVSIAHGQALYGEHCAACHGKDGRGTASVGQNPAVSDLTADHIYEHTDGDLFWWISHGINDVMPGFASAIDDAGRWNLIDFVHANADAVRLRRGDNVAFRLPDFSAGCPDGSTVSRDDLRGRIVHIVMAGADSADRLRELAGLQLDRTTLVIALDRLAAEDLPFCVVQDHDVARGFAVYLGEGTDAAGTEFLVDATGGLRAMWHPGLDPTWTDASILETQIARMREPASGAVPGPTAHSHTH
jgi:copper resistance protein D